MKALSGIELGVAGQLRVAAELILHGHRPAFSLIDKGVDLVTEEGLRIQIKTARLREYRKGRWQYSFNAQRWDHKGPHGLDGVDFVIFWGIDDDIFWVVPVELVSSSQNVRITPNGSPRTRTLFDRSAHENAWHLLDRREGDAT